MSYSDDVQREVVEHVSQIFDLDYDADNDAIVQSNAIEKIREELIHRIITLLNSSAEKLFAILYRIDVSEASVNNVFNTALPPDVPELLADLIIERQTQKAITRKQFKQ